MWIEFLNLIWYYINLRPNSLIFGLIQFKQFYNNHVTSIKQKEYGKEFSNYNMAGFYQE